MKQLFPDLRTLAARCYFMLQCVGLLTASTAAAVDGTFTVTETWSVTLEYSRFAGGFTGTRSFSGTQSGTIRITNGKYQFLDRTGVPWTAPGQDLSLKNRTISFDGVNYRINGGYAFAPAFGSSAYGLVFLGCFAVKVPLIDGEVPAFYRYQYYSGSGPLSAIQGEGNMIGGSLEAYVSSTVSLKEVVAAPAISQQPKSQTAIEGQNVSFTVAAGGKAPLGYLWRKGANVLPGANATALTLTNVQLGDAGGYSVTVTNLGGKITSATAQLTVLPPPPPWFEGWESATLKSYTPSSNALVAIAGDKGRWVVGDTVSLSSNCGPPLNHADIVLENGRKLLKITSVASGSACSDSIGVSIDRRTSSSLPIPLFRDIQISFVEKGAMVNPVWNGYFGCVAPPCGDTVSLAVGDNRGNVVVYIFQRAPNYVEHTGIGYTEIFLDSAGGAFTRNLFDDFARIAGEDNVGTTIEGVSFSIASHGWATLDSLLIGSSSTNSDRVKPALAVTSPAANARLTNATVTIKGTSSDNVGVAQIEYRLENGDGIGAYQMAAGTDSWLALVDGLAPGTNTVRIRARDVTGNVSAEAARTVTFVVLSPFDLTIDGSGIVTPNMDGQLLEVGRNYTLTAKPGAGSVFSNWTGGVVANAPTLKFVMRSNLVLQASFVPNPFIASAGVYNGLFSDTNGVAEASSGYFSATATGNGSYSARMQLAGKLHLWTGQFTVGGLATNTINRGSLGFVTLELEWQLGGGNSIMGRVKSAGWTAELRSYRSPFKTLTRPAPYAGKYTMVILGVADRPANPAGDGFGTVTVTPAGSVQFSGPLGDGTKVTQASSLSIDGQWPFYVSLNSGQGSILGWLSFTNETSADLAGSVTWIKPMVPVARYYPAGFEQEASVIGSRYVPVAGTNKVLNFTDGIVSFSGGNLAQPITNAVTFSANNKITNLSSNKLTLTIASPSGLFSGSVIDPITGKLIPFSGAVLQKAKMGAGLFLGTNESGAVIFSPAP